jgi:hypothetical protein
MTNAAKAAFSSTNDETGARTVIHILEFFFDNSRTQRQKSSNHLSH